MLMNTADQFKSLWGSKIERIKKLIPRLIRILGNEALLFFNEQFKKQQDPEGKQWQKRKDASNGRALLVKSGRLRKSIRIQRSTGNTIRIGTDVSYAKYHNSGTDRLPQRRFLGGSTLLNRRLQRMVQYRVRQAFNG
jgi:phage gpG-like protein